MSDIPRRDKLVDEAIDILQEHLRRSKYDYAVAFNTLGHIEDQFITNEIRKCKVDPRYYLENYHTIQTEDEGFRTLYPLWDSQEIFYNEIMQMVNANRPAKVVVLKARQLGLCLEENTRILTSDLRWVAIKDVNPGDHVIAVDEGQSEEEAREQKSLARRNRKSRKRGNLILQSVSVRRKDRKMRTASVVAKAVTVQRAYRLTFDDGRTLVCSLGHRWLCKRRGGCEPEWRKTERIAVGDQVRYITKPWGASSYEDGWFGGFLDGEGSVRQKSKEYGGSEVSVSQVENSALERAEKYLQSEEYSYRFEREKVATRRSKFGNNPVHKLVVSRMDEIFRLLGKTRPARMIGNQWWEGKSLPGKNSGIGWARIVSIEDMGEMRLVDLQTSTKTFIAEGFVSHNSTISEGLIFHRTIFTPAVTSMIVAQDPTQSAYLFDMFLRAYDNLPWWMQPEKLFRSKGRYMEFASAELGRTGLNSKILVEAANKMSGVGVGKTIRAGHFSELSAWDDPEILTEQLWPTMNAKDELAIMESTARGRSGAGKFWYDFWNECVDKWGSDDTWEWKPIFIEWFRCSVSTIDNKSVGKYSRSTEGKAFEPTQEELAFRQRVLKTTPDHFFIPDEMLKWRRYKIQETISATGDEYSFRQEYASNPTEAFKSSGTCAFPREILSKILDTTCYDPRWVGEISYRPNESTRFHLNLTDVAEERKKNPRFVVPSTNYIGGRLRVWERPEPGESYYIGADVAQGIEGRDYSCAQVIKIGHGGAPDEQVAEWHGWINPTPYAHVLAALGYWFNTCEISSEINDCGQKTYMELYRILEYPQLFRWKHYDRVKHFYSDLMAWQTTSKTRPLLITKLRELLLDRTIILHSEELVDELYTFASDDDGGRFEGQDNNDDMAFGLMISLWCAHDSDYGQQAASKPQAAGAAKYYVIDAKGIPIPQCHPSGEPVSREEAMGWCGMNPTWSVRRQLQRADLANTDFSPVHDRQGPRQAMHYEMGIPAEQISASNIVEREGVNPELDWRNY